MTMKNVNNSNKSQEDYKILEEKYDNLLKDYRLLEEQHASLSKTYEELVHAYCDLTDLLREIHNKTNNF